MNAPNDGTHADFVYMGRRLDTKDVVAVLGVVQPDGTLKEKMFNYDKKSWGHFVVGGVYTGARFHEQQVIGFNTAKWTKQYASDEVMGWRAQDQHVAVFERSQREQANAKRVDEIADLLLPLRKLYASYGRVGNFAGQEALRSAVDRALRKAPRKDES